MTGQLPSGAAIRRGPFKPGDRVQLTDSKGRLNTIELTAGKLFHTHHGFFQHDDLIGRDEGSIVQTTVGDEYLALRPLLADYVLSMPRGAAVIYPKDAGQIIAMGDIYPGARVVEAGVGSGALTMSLLRAVGDSGSLLSIERREDFAEIAQANVEIFFGGSHPAWELAIGDLADQLGRLREPGSVDRIVLDMLAPWENVEQCAVALAPGGVLLCYVATTTQLSRVAETLRNHGGFTEPQAWESMVRTWHLEGLAVRPDHRMVGHTGFLLSARRMAAGVMAPARRRRPSRGAYGEDSGATVPGTSEDANESRVEDPVTFPYDPGPVPGGEWKDEDLGVRGVSKKKLRKVRRALSISRDASAASGPDSQSEAEKGEAS